MGPQILRHPWQEIALVQGNSRWKHLAVFPPSTCTVSKLGLSHISSCVQTSNFPKIMGCFSAWAFVQNSTTRDPQGVVSKTLVCSPISQLFLAGSMLLLQYRSMLFLKGMKFFHQSIDLIQKDFCHPALVICHYSHCIPRWPRCLPPWRCCLLCLPHKCLLNSCFRLCEVMQQFCWIHSYFIILDVYTWSLWIVANQSMSCCSCVLFISGLQRRVYKGQRLCFSSGRHRVSFPVPQISMLIWSSRWGISSITQSPGCGCGARARNGSIELRGSDPCACLSTEACSTIQH